jgi:hypothetical protein
MTQNINIGFFDNISYGFANIYETDKVICFSQPKVGSRTLDTLWKDKNYSAELGIEKRELYWYDIQMRGATHDKEQTLRFEKTLNNILLGLEKRDIIFFYRNPINRYVSGLYQDLLSHYEDYPDGDGCNEALDFLKKHPDSSFKSLPISEELRQKLIPKIENFLNIRICENYEYGHIIMYLSSYLSLIHRSKIIQGGNVFLFNIESQNMNNILKNYFDADSIKKVENHLNSNHQDLKQLVEEIFYEQNMELLDLVKTKLKQETTMYQLLRNSSLNYKGNLI